MPMELEIGRVIAIDTAQVTIELSKELKALSRATYEREVEVGRINSYVIIPVGARRIVAMVTRVVMAEEAEIRTDKTLVALPSARRIMKATMIGTIDGTQFTQGISLFPVLDAPVLIAANSDLEALFGCDVVGAGACTLDRPGFCVPIGKAAAFPEFDVSINPDSFFGKHAAVIGSTGAGKSCSVATVIQSILQRSEVRNARFVILDTNGEYQEAFQKPAENDRWVGAHRNYRCLYIPTDPAHPDERLAIPYWFMDSDDFVRLFRASPGIQRPVLLDALRLARVPALPSGELAELRDDLNVELHTLLALADSSEKTSKDVRKTALSLSEYVEARKDTAAGLVDVTALTNALSEVSDEAEKHIEGVYPTRLPLASKVVIRETIQPFIDQIVGSTSGHEIVEASADTPVFFRKEALRRDYLERVMRRQEAGAAKARDYCATMLMRMHRLYEDKRFDFLFGPVGAQWPEPYRALSAFMRDIFGLPPNEAGQLSSLEDVPAGLLPFYDRQRAKPPQSYNVVVIDLSLLAAEVLENVTALLGRLILEFLQRLGEESVSGVRRGDFPVVLVLEEAQNYIPERRHAEDESISRDVFERIAREGRKYGLGLLVASQRPSELSKTVLSQCNSFIVHRLQNPEDLRYFREIVPAIYGDLLAQLPALAQRYALLLGECVRAPALVYMRESDPVPRSRDPKFWERWCSEHTPMPDVEPICAKWEGGPEAPAAAAE